MIANTDSSVTSSPMNSGRRPSKGSVCHQFPHTARLGEACMLDFADAFSGQHLDRRIRQIGADQRDRFVDRLSPHAARDGNATPANSPCLPAGFPGLSFATAASRRFNSLSIGGACVATASPSSESRISAPWPPTEGNTSGAKIRSISLSDRPLTSANAPAERRRRLLRLFARSGGTHTSRGVGARSSSVPSMSSRIAVSPTWRHERTRRCGPSLHANDHPAVTCRPSPDCDRSRHSTPQQRAASPPIPTIFVPLRRHIATPPRPR